MSNALLETIVPVTCVLFAVWPAVNSEALLLVIFVIALICPAVWPPVEALSMKLAVLVCTYVLSLIRRRENAVATHLIIFPLALIGGAVGPHILSLALLAAIIEHPFINRIVTQFLPTLTMLHIVLPFTNIFLLLFLIVVFPVSVRLIILEVTGVGVAIGVQELTLAVGFSVDDFAGVLSTVRPVQSSCTMRNKHELFLTVIAYRVQVNRSRLANCADYFHLTCVGRSIGINLIVLFFNQMLIRQLVNRWIPPLCQIIRQFTRSRFGFSNILLLFCFYILFLEGHMIVALKLNRSVNYRHDIHLALRPPFEILLLIIIWRLNIID